MENSKRMWWLNEESKSMLNRGYLLRGETPEAAINRIAFSAAKQLNMPEMKDKFIELVEKGWMSLSSPIWSNCGTERGLPISCFGTHMKDSIKGIAYKVGEVIEMTRQGGGTSGYFGELRPRGAAITNNGESSGAVSFMRFFDTTMEVVSQGNTRRGAFAAYLDIDHEDINEFLEIKDIGSPIQNLFIGVCVSDLWMNEMIEGNSEHRKLWAKVLQSRKEKGLPYIFFTDNVNRGKPQVYKDKNMMINASNLCSEIALPSSFEESFVCCLSSMNLELYDEWKDTDALRTATFFLDAVMSEFIEKTKGSNLLVAAHRFAKNSRSLGLGVMGWHSYLQKHNIPFESFEAKQLTTVIFKTMEQQTYAASAELAILLGEPELLKGYGRRNATLMAIAPTTSSSSILGQTSAGIEPYSSNYYKVGLAKGNFTRRNKFLKNLLVELNLDNEDIWRSIMNNAGSVQHLNELTAHQKDVFKTFKEISQLEIIQQASIRQKFIDQSQSLNLNIPPDMSPKDVNKLIVTAWKLGVKTLYYQRSQSVSKEFLANMVDCSSCEG